MSSLDEGSVQRALKLSLIEGGAWACMVGLAETYFVAVAVHLGATPLELGLVVALPLATGGLGPLAALLGLHRLPRRRRFSVAATALQVLTLAVTSTLLWTGGLGVAELIVAICLYQITGQAAGTAWSSWYGDLVPAGIRGRYFGRRNRVVYLSTCAGLVAGGLFLQWMEPGGVSGEGSRRAFAVLFGLAAGFRAISSALLARSPEPEFAGIGSRQHFTRFVRTDRGGRALRILLLGAVFHFTVYMGSPYFAPFMLEELAFTYAQYMIAALVVIVAKAVFASLWGPLVDRKGAKLVFLSSLLCVALVPLPWVWANGLVLVLAAQVFSGASWSGYEVGYFALLLENSTSKTRPYVFVLQSLFNGAMQISGVLFAAQVLLPRLDGFREVFLASAAARLLVAGSAPLVLAGLRGRGISSARLAAIRLFGLRPHGGFSVRPVLTRDPNDED